VDVLVALIIALRLAPVQDFFVAGKYPILRAVGYWFHLRDPVIPAKAGIYSANLWKCAVVALDSRFRGNDRRIEWIPIPNDTSTKAAMIRY